MVRFNLIKFKGKLRFKLKYERFNHRIRFVVKNEINKNTNIIK